MSRRVTSVATLALLLLQVAVPILAESGCLESCADDEGECSPVCSTCSGCPHSRVALAAALIEDGFGLLTERASEQGRDTVPTTFPTDILHVPILS